VNHTSDTESESDLCVPSSRVLLVLLLLVRSSMMIEVDLATYIAVYMKVADDLPR
jgi:hypothetical protein